MNKNIINFTDSSDLREPEKARASQEKALQALQQYTIAHYPDMPSKFGELLLRIPDLQRTCQVSFLMRCRFHPIVLIVTER